MQYPPPGHRPYAPAEIYWPQQPQLYAPQYQPPMPAQDIAIYADRGMVIFLTVVITICVFLMIFLFFLQTEYISANDSSTLISQIADFASLALFGWITWGAWRMVLDFVIARKPALFISREGITVNRIPTLSGFFISWAEIESISTRRFIYKYFCIRPKNTNAFLARFHIVERLLRRGNMLFGISPLSVSQACLDRSSEEIFYLLYYMYANELNYYRVRLQP